MGRRGYGAEEKAHKMKVIKACRQGGISLYASVDAAGISFPTYKRWVKSGDFDMDESTDVYTLKSEIKRLKAMVVRREDKVQALAFKVKVLSAENKSFKEMARRMEFYLKDEVIKFLKGEST
jgi:hypothetical protein